MKKIYLSIITIAFLLLSTTSCGDFLDVDSREKVEGDDAAVVFTPEMLVNGVYGSFTDWDYAFSYLAITEIISDNADKGSSSTDPGGDKLEFDNLEYTSAAGSIKSMWKRWYKTIGRATKTIEYIEEQAASGVEIPNKDRLIGEARFLRAVSYFFLVRGWGDVPLQHKELDVRVPAAEVYAYIEEDFNYAKSVLPIAKDYSAGDLGRASKGAADGFLAKVYLYQKKYQEAYDAATRVADKGVYGYDLLEDYAKVWRLEGENSKESLFEIQARGESLAHGVHQYSQTQGARGTTGWGWGFNTPTQNLVDAFDAQGDEIRKNATIIFRNSTLYDGYKVGATDNARYNYKAYSSANQGAADTDKNIRMLRLGEILLIKAEAANELGKTDEALAALKRVRDRVKLSEVKERDQLKLRKIIWDERRLELAFEHDRWFDLVRTGQGKDAMAANGKTFVVGKHELFPIPYDQVLELPAIGQNPNWN